MRSSRPLQKGERAYAVGNPMRKPIAIGPERVLDPSWSRLHSCPVVCCFYLFFPLLFACLFGLVEIEGLVTNVFRFLLVRVSLFLWICVFVQSTKREDTFRVNVHVFISFFPPMIRPEKVHQYHRKRVKWLIRPFWQTTHNMETLFHDRASQRSIPISIPNNPNLSPQSP